MQRQVDHHLARARAVGRRGAAQARAVVWESVGSVSRAVAALYPDVRLDATGDKELVARVERQDLDEILGNLIENAAKYGGGSVFVTVSKDGDHGHHFDNVKKDFIRDYVAPLIMGRPVPERLKPTRFGAPAAPAAPQLAPAPIVPPFPTPAPAPLPPQP